MWSVLLETASTVHRGYRNARSVTRTRTAVSTLIPKIVAAGGVSVAGPVGGDPTRPGAGARLGVPGARVTPGGGLGDRRWRHTMKKATSVLVAFALGVAMPVSWALADEVKTKGWAPSPPRPVMPSGRRP